MIDNYIDEFLGPEPTEETGDDEAIPDWTSKNNASLAAYLAIKKLETEKKRYIDGHASLSHYSDKSRYHIFKNDVGKLIGKKPQPIFNGTNYSKKLTQFYNDTNERLRIRKEKKTIQVKKGLQHYSKSDLIKTTKELSHENDDIRKTNCEYLFEKLLANMTIDVKNKLGIR